MGSCCSKGEEYDIDGVSDVNYVSAGERSALLGDNGHRSRKLESSAPPRTVGAPETRQDTSYSFFVSSPGAGRSGRRRVQSYMVGKRNEQPLLSVVGTVWRRPFAEHKSAATDLPRLARRLHVHAEKFRAQGEPEDVARFDSQASVRISDSGSGGSGFGSGSAGQQSHGNSQHAAYGSTSGVSRSVDHVEEGMLTRADIRAELDAARNRLQESRAVVEEVKAVDRKVAAEELPAMGDSSSKESLATTASAESQKKGSKSPASALLAGNARRSLPAILLRRILKCAALLHCSESELLRIRTVFERHFPHPQAYSSKKEQSQSLVISAFRNCLWELFPPDQKIEPPLAKLLKCVNQGMLAPAAVRLKTQLPFIYCDRKNGWDVYIIIGPNAVEVRHVKGERNPKSSKDDPGGEFRFDWEFTMYFSADMRRLQRARLRVVKVEFGSETTADVRRALKAYLQPLMQQ